MVSVHPDLDFQVDNTSDSDNMQIYSASLDKNSYLTKETAYLSLEVGGGSDIVDSTIMASIGENELSSLNHQLLSSTLMANGNREVLTSF